MNVIGYFDSEDVWLPDPILKQAQVYQSQNDYKSKKGDNQEDSAVPENSEPRDMSKMFGVSDSGDKSIFEFGTKSDITKPKDQTYAINLSHMVVKENTTFIEDNNSPMDLQIAQDRTNTFLDESSLSIYDKDGQKIEKSKTKKYDLKSKFLGNSILRSQKSQRSE